MNLNQFFFSLLIFLNSFPLQTFGAVDQQGQNNQQNSQMQVLNPMDFSDVGSKLDSVADFSSRIERFAKKNEDRILDVCYKDIDRHAQHADERNKSFFDGYNLLMTETKKKIGSEGCKDPSKEISEALDKILLHSNKLQSACMEDAKNTKLMLENLDQQRENNLKAREARLKSNYDQAQKEIELFKEASKEMVDAKKEAFDVQCTQFSEATRLNREAAKEKYETEKEEIDLKKRRELAKRVEEHDKKVDELFETYLEQYEKDLREARERARGSIERTPPEIKIGNDGRRYAVPGKVEYTTCIIQ